jgi:hypothetical protein
MTRRLLTIIVTITMILVLSPATTSAAPPSNDDFAGRTIIPSLPFTDTIDTTDATADPTDPVGCGGPNIPTVWYEYTAETSMRVFATTVGSDHDAGINVFVGDPADPASLRLVNCGLPSLVFYGVPGETYYLMVTPPGPRWDGGTLVVTAEEAPPPVEFDLAIDPVGSVNAKTGIATISGTVTCSRPAWVSIQLDVVQRLGRMLIRGWGYAWADCDGTTPFTATVIGDSGLFTGGKATVIAWSYACDAYDCSFEFEERNVRLTGKQ